MRPVLHGDVSNTARALLNVPADKRLSLCKTIIRQAEQAEVYVCRTGHLHPAWGNGSRISAARKYPRAPEPTFDDPDYRDCFGLVLTCLDGHAHSAVNRMHN